MVRERSVIAFQIASFPRTIRRSARAQTRIVRCRWRGWGAGDEMGLLIEGVWRDDSHDTKRMQGGAFVRPTTRYRNWITLDGSAGPSGEGGFAPARGRYHLYVALSCPWAHRT